MSHFRIVPVIDLLNSTAVHAIKGDRKNYQPLKTPLINSADPLKIIQFLNHKMDFDEFYIADLDSIINKKPNIKIISKILNISSIKIMLDPGIENKKDLMLYSKLKLNKIILGMETINSIKDITECLEILGAKRIIVSIDLYKGNIISRIKNWKHQEPEKIITELENLGIKELILLDLFRVGQKVGGIPQSYLQIQRSFSGNVLVGGGIRDIEDIISLKEENFSGVLIATALYDKSIEIDDLKKI